MKALDLEVITTNYMFLQTYDYQFPLFCCSRTIYRQVGFLGLVFIVIFDNYWFHFHFNSRADANLSSARYLVATDKAIEKIILELLLVSCNQIVSTKAWVMSWFEIPPS